VSVRARAMNDEPVVDYNYVVKWWNIPACKLKCHPEWNNGDFKSHISYNNCHHNMLYSMEYRHSPLIPTGLPKYIPNIDFVEGMYSNILAYQHYLQSKMYWLKGLNIVGLIKSLANDIGEVHPWTLQQVYDDKRPHLRKRFKVAMEYLEKYDVMEKHAKVLAFVKNERMDGNKVKPPRLIQARTPIFTMALQQYLRPIEKAMSNMDLPVTNKEMNLDETYDLLAGLTEYDLSAYLLLDHESFDSCVNGFLLSMEHLLYHLLYNDPRLLRLLSMQYLNKGRSHDSRIKYKIFATRMSGDANTALGNTIVNLLYIRILMYLLDHRDVVCGDDSVVKFRLADKAEVIQRISVANGVIFKTKAVVVEDFQEVDFCQCKPNIFMRTMVKDPFRTLSRACICINSNVHNEYEFKLWQQAFYNSNKFLEDMGCSRFIGQFNHKVKDSPMFHESDYSLLYNVSNRVNNIYSIECGYSTAICMSINSITIADTFNPIPSRCVPVLGNFASLINEPIKETVKTETISD